MIIKSIAYKNFRQYKGEYTINFATDPEENVTILLGNNTCGKTTLLQMFNWCLYNKVKFSSKKDKSLLNKEVELEMKHGSREIVRVKMDIEHSNKRYTIMREQVYHKINSEVKSYESDVKVSYVDSTGQTTSVGRLKTESVINSILPEGLSEYFLFDTERVQNIAGSSELETSIKTLLGLKQLDDAISHLGAESLKTTVIGRFYEELAKNKDQNLQKYVVKMKSAQEKIDNANTQIEAARIEIENYEKEEHRLVEVLATMETTKKIQQEVKRLEEKLAKEEAHLEKYKKDYQMYFSRYTKDIFINPLVNQVQQFIDHAQVEEKTLPDVTSKTINSILKSGVCLCGAKITSESEAYKHLQAQLKFVPPESIGTMVKRFKKEIQGYKSRESQGYDILKGKIEEYHKIQDNVFTLRDQIEIKEQEIAGKEDAGKYQQQLNLVRGRKKEKHELINRLSGEIRLAQQIIVQCKKLIDESEAKTLKSQELECYLAYAKRLAEDLKEKYIADESKLTTELKQKVNEIFERMYHGKNCILEIDSNYKTTIYECSNGRKTLHVESEGLTRVKNFSFIAGLVAIAKEKAGKATRQLGKPVVNECYPLILDAPFSNVDELHIKGIAKELPIAAEQVIMFVMEKDWKYAVETMGDKVGKYYSLEKVSEFHTQIKEGGN